jgi:hypothetical protein
VTDEITPPATTNVASAVELPPTVNGTLMCVPFVRPVIAEIAATVDTFMPVLTITSAVGFDTIAVPAITVVRLTPA